MDIAPGFTCSDWAKLDLSSPDGGDWDTAVGVLRARIKERYLDPVDVLIEHEEHKHYSERRFGFSILGIDCLLVEALQAFKDGREETKRGEGKGVFVRYLTKTSSLGQHFTSELAEQFYQNYRNGILHQAQIKTDSRVWSIGPVVHEVDGAMVINRTAFHNALKADFEEYIHEFGDVRNVLLRQNLQKKMDSLCK